MFSRGVIIGCKQRLPRSDLSGGRSTTGGFMLGSLLNVGDRVRRLAGCFAVVDLNLADALCGIDSLVSARRLEDSDRDERAVHRVPCPVRGSVYLVLDDLEDFPGVG